MDVQQLLETFSRWLGRIPADAAILRDAALCEAAPREARRLLVGSLDYLPRQFDIIPDHFPEIGALDDAFVLRIGAMLALKAGLGDAPLEIELGLRRLADDVPAIRGFLGDAYPLLVAYVVRLPDVKARGRDADLILDDAQVRDSFLRELRRDLEEGGEVGLHDPASLELVRRFVREKCTQALPAR